METIILAPRTLIDRIAYGSVSESRTLKIKTHDNI